MKGKQSEQRKIEDDQKTGDSSSLQVERVPSMEAARIHRDSLATDRMSTL